MRVEYFANGSDDCPLILLYGADSGDAITLSEAFHTLSQSGATRVAAIAKPLYGDIAQVRITNGCVLNRSTTVGGLAEQLAENRFFLIPDDKSPVR